MDKNANTSYRAVTRRRFLAHSGAAALMFSIVRSAAVRGTAANSRIEAGCIGLGQRGSMIARMVAQHGGYHIAAVADYFPQVAAKAGETFKVPEARRYSGLSAYQKLIADAIARLKEQQGQ